MIDFLIDEFTEIDEFTTWATNWTPYFEEMCNLGIPDKISAVISIILGFAQILTIPILILIVKTIWNKLKNS